MSWSHAMGLWIGFFLLAYLIWERWDSSPRRQKQKELKRLRSLEAGRSAMRDWK